MIVLCFALDNTATLRRVSSYWMPELRRLGVHVPVMLVGCKSDVRPADQSLHQVGVRCVYECGVWVGVGRSLGEWGVVCWGEGALWWGEAHGGGWTHVTPMDTQVLCTACC